MNNYRYQNLSERIEKLKRHVKSRRGRRDLHALGTLVDIAEYLKGSRRPTTLRSMDAMLRAYYNAESDFLDSYVKRASQPFFAMVQKDDNCSPDRAYLVPVSFLPEARDGESSVPDVSGVRGDHADGREEERGLVCGVVANCDAQESNGGSGLCWIREKSMKYLQEERFIVNSNDKQSLKNYADNYDRIFSDEAVAKAIEPNESPVVSEHTMKDPDTGSEIDVTKHEDGSVTVVAERLVSVLCPWIPIEEAQAQAMGVCPHCGRKLDEYGVCPDL